MPENNKNTSTMHTANHMPASATHLTLTVVLFRSIIDYCREIGIDYEAVLAVANLQEADLSELDKRIPFEAYMAAFETAATLSGDPFFGLHFGEQIKPGHYGIVGMVAMSCSKASELMDLHSQYQSLVADNVINHYETTEEGVRLTCTPKVDNFTNNRLHFESAFSAWITLARWITGLKNHYPIEVCFTFPAPDELSEYHRVFGENIRFEQPAATVLFDSVLMNAPIPQSNPALRRQLETQANELLLKAGGNQTDPVLQKVQHLIANSLADGTPDIESVAEQLAMSTRALQRKMSELDSSFSKLLDSTRQELAMSYIQKPHVSLTEIAFLLGFSEQSAFNRAFKRWTGDAPSSYRNKKPS